MRHALLVLGLVGALALAGRGPSARAEDPTPEERAFVEVLATPEACVVGEPVRLVLRFGFDRDWFRDHAVPLFLRRLDLPIQVDAPWMREAWPRETGAVPLADLPLADPPPGEGTAPGRDAQKTFALGGEVAAAVPAGEVDRGGRPWTVYEATRRLLQREPGGLSLAAPTLRFAWASRFETDAVGLRVAVDRQEVVVRGAGRTVAVRALPEEGRPPEFDGAVGRFTVEADLAAGPAAGAAADPRGIVRLRLRISGEGNLEALPAPRPERIPGFHVYGTTDDHDPRRRTITYEVAPLASDGMEIPAIPFAFYDPGPPPGYRVVRTSPLPLPDRGPAPAAGLPGPHTGAGPSGGEAAAPAGAGWIAAVAGLGLVALAAAGAWVVARRRGRRPPPAEVPVDPAVARRAAATAAVRAALGRPGARAPAGDPRAPPDPALADAFAEFLAAHLGLPTAAAIGPDLPGRLAAADVPPIAAARAATVLERLVGARYGGRDATVEAESAVGGLVDELEACFRSHRGG